MSTPFDQTSPKVIITMFCPLRFRKKEAISRTDQFCFSSSLNFWRAVFARLSLLATFDGVGQANARIAPVERTTNHNQHLSVHSLSSQHVFCDVWRDMFLATWMSGRSACLALGSWQPKPMPKGFQSQQCQRYGRYGLEWTASFCCPWLFKAPVVAVPDNSPKAGRRLYRSFYINLLQWWDSGGNVQGMDVVGRKRVAMFGLRHQPHREAESVALTVSLQDHAEDSKAARTPDVPLLAEVW